MGAGCGGDGDPGRPSWHHFNIVGFPISQNKGSRDPSSYVKLSVGKKTYTSKVRVSGVQAWGKELSKQEGN